MEINKDFLKGYNNFDIYNYDENKESIVVNMSLPDSFKKLLKDAVHLDYIGTGNPNADILIIGKEMAIDKDRSMAQYKTTVQENIQRWNSMLGSEVVIRSLYKYKGNPKFWDYYSPVFPYYIQKNMISTTNGGTSRTEYAYQKLIDNIYNDSKKSELLNFHVFSFMSELSIAVANMSPNVNKEDRLKSLKERKMLWKSEFFTKFPITILAVGHYLDISENGEKVIKVNNREECSGSCFNIAFYGPTINVGKKFINVHFITDNNGKERMLIHTNQFSAYTNDLIEKIGILCKTFLQEGLSSAKKVVDEWNKI